jgi:hypothetical protein
VIWSFLHTVGPVAQAVSSVQSSNAHVVTYVRERRLKRVTHAL